MGLDTSHGCWHGAYSAFHRWREKLAEVAGIQLPFMEGFYDDDSTARVKIRWDALKPDILHELLSHSDCDGELAADICAPLADRLTALLPLLDGDGGGHLGYYREATQRFIKGLRLAASKREPVEFR